MCGRTDGGTNGRLLGGVKKSAFPSSRKLVSAACDSWRRTVVDVVARVGAFSGNRIVFLGETRLVHSVYNTVVNDDRAAIIPQAGGTGQNATNRVCRSDFPNGTRIGDCPHFRGA